jgi:hypothetical protein
MTMRPCWQVFAVAMIFFASPSVAELSHGSRLLERVSDNLETFTAPLIVVSDETNRREPDSIILAFMSGKCSTLKIAGHDFACRAVAFYQTEQGRANFTIALDDPADDSHIITFSGENGRREQDRYELSVDRMLLKSRDRPKVDGMPAPLVESSTGICKQLGNLATSQISSISCLATSTNGRKYELRFESDGSPTRVMRLRESPVPTEKRRAKQVEQFECRLKADVANVLPRDRAAYIIQCLGEDSQEPAPAGNQ